MKNLSFRTNTSPQNGHRYWYLQVKRFFLRKKMKNDTHPKECLIAR